MKALRNIGLGLLGVILLGGCTSPFVKSEKEECGPLYNANASSLQKAKTTGFEELLIKLLERHLENQTTTASYDYRFRGQSFEFVECKARFGDREAQYLTAMYYLHGEKTVQDYGKAREWFKKAAKPDNGYDYLSITQSDGTIMALPHKARPATKGHTGAQYQLGMMYLQGLGVERDAGKAKKWFERAAAQGSKRSREILEGLENG